MTRFWWVTDDAFISFRYARNLTRGLGLVYNAGERVEGYTNFLWTLLGAGAIRGQVDPVIVANVLGITSYFGTAFILLRLSRYLHRAAGLAPVIPIAALAILVHTDVQRFATGGLETAWVMCLVVLAFAFLLMGTHHGSRLGAGIALGLAALSRPDSLIFLVAAGAFVAWERRHVAARMTALWAPALVLYVPYWFWRFSYYGYPFPNTYYAKSASRPYWEQGWTYLILYLQTYYVLLLIPVVLALAFWRLRRKPHTGDGPYGVRVFVLLLLFTIPYTVYVVRVGGDFMFARFWVVVTPLYYLILEAGMRVMAPATKWRVMGLVAVSLLTLLRWNPWQDRYLYKGIADEPAFYGRGWQAETERVGRRMQTMFGDYPVRVAAGGGVSYYGDFAWAIEPMGGLTDTALAHRPLERRGRPGHEKGPSLNYLRSLGVHFTPWPVAAPSSVQDSLRSIRLGGLEMAIVTYDVELMTRLVTKPDTRFIVLPDYLDQIIPQLKQRPAGDVLELNEFLQAFYFDHNEDPERQQALQEALDEITAASADEG